MTIDKINKQGIRHVARMNRHVDGCLVIYSLRDEDGDTVSLASTSGNTHAVIGVVREWLASQDNHDRGYSTEEGRYDAVVDRQLEQARQQQQQSKQKPPQEDE